MSANDKIATAKRRIFGRDCYQCCFPGCKDQSNHIELAHGIAQTEANAKMIVRLWREMFGEEITIKQSWEIIHDDRNLFTSCKAHNSKFNIGYNPEKVRKHLEEVRRGLK
jgi:hypothetical protein